jgi:hypothetical protein
MHQARRLVANISDELESELREDALRGKIVGMVPDIDFGQPQFLTRTAEAKPMRAAQSRRSPSVALT